jgi:hypothetical protein
MTRAAMDRFIYPPEILPFVGNYAAIMPGVPLAA